MKNEKEIQPLLEGRDEEGQWVHDGLGPLGGYDVAWLRRQDCLN